MQLVSMKVVFQFKQFFSMKAIFSIQTSPKHYTIIIMGNFYVDILKDNNQPKNKQELFISQINSN
jgi:hypothetical protein